MTGIAPRQRHEAAQAVERAEHVMHSVEAAGRIGRVLGQTGINVMTRLMGLILAAIAVEVMSDGLVKLFPALGH